MDEKISQLPGGAVANLTDEVPVVNDPGGSAETQRKTLKQVGDLLSQVYEGRAPAPPNDPTRAALSYPTGGGILSQWIVATQQWI